MPQDGRVTRTDDQGPIEPFDGAAGRGRAGKNEAGEAAGAGVGYAPGHESVETADRLGGATGLEQRQRRLIRRNKGAARGHDGGRSPAGSSSVRHGVSRRACQPIIPSRPFGRIMRAGGLPEADGNRSNRAEAPLRLVKEADKATAPRPPPSPSVGEARRARDEPRARWPGGSRKRFHLSQDQQAPRQLRRGLQLDRYVISVDGQRKMGFVDRVAAEQAADRLRTDFPLLTVLVSDQEEEIIRERVEAAR
jgi:hypothetical protein